MLRIDETMSRSGFFERHYSNVHQVWDLALIALY